MRELGPETLAQLWGYKMLVARCQYLEIRSVQYETQNRDI